MPRLATVRGAEEDPGTRDGARFCGREFGAAELAAIRAVVERGAGLSRMALARTVCERVEWTRPSGALKARECREFLETLAAAGQLRLPAKRRRKPVGARTRVPLTAQGEPGPPLEGDVGQFEPIGLEPVRTLPQRELFRELVGRYHYRGHAVPYGAQLRYLVWATPPTRAAVVVGAVQFSSPAWRMAARDRWIGWDEASRRRNLQRVVNNSRFLLLPWVRVRNLASRVLARAARGVARDWPVRYGVEVLLLETLVDRGRFRGSCYRAANWIEVGGDHGTGPDGPSPSPGGRGGEGGAAVSSGARRGSAAAGGVRGAGGLGPRDAPGAVYRRRRLLCGDEGVPDVA